MGEEGLGPPLQPGEGQPGLPKEPGGLLGPGRKVGAKSKSSMGPPPRPFKKARYAWEIKNYEHTVSNMAQSLGGECSVELHDDSQDSQSSDVNSDGSQEDGAPTARDDLPVGGLDRASFMDPRARARPDLMPPIMPAPYPTTYGMMAAPPPPEACPPPGEGPKEGPPVPPDPDAGILRWHARQLCRSILDNTMNRMLENMGFSPVTERSQGIHPLLVLSLSDDEEREAEEAQRALENEALTAAMHHKGLFLPPYHYDPLESATTTDYDSSEEDSDLPDDPGPDDLPPHDPPLRLAPAVARPLPRPPEVQPPSPRRPTPPPRPPEADCEGESQEGKPDLDANKNSTAGDLSPCPEPPHQAPMPAPASTPTPAPTHTPTTTPAPVPVPQEPRAEALKQPGREAQHKAENENNNDKYFVDQAIEVAIKHQGLGYQQA
ncbi:hypothetical protein E2C01_025001 [Portunus trituberculatus]|uniref:Uncharacterized protein n=2 Tax=Portunus trituberculatus TaxID=210409 RepID=A0A5B7EEA9_PORTR|nr:hypothetical protein [Portunus trituberculatus]